MKTNTRQKIIESSTNVMLVQGFNYAGINQILKLIKVPKGSFYNHFESKEALGVAVLGEYGDMQVELLESLIKSCPEKSGLAQLEYVFDSLIELFSENLEACNCLLSNFAQELSLQSDDFRIRIENQFIRIEDIYTQLFCLAVEQGDLEKDTNCRVLAETLQASWSGAIMRMKLKQDIAPLKNFKSMFFKSLNTQI